MMSIKSIFFNLTLLALSALLFSCKTQKYFVRVNNTNFTIKNKPYDFVSANFWYCAYLGADADYGNRGRLIRELNRLQKFGVKNLRVAAVSEESDYGFPLSPPFQYKNGAYNEKLLQGLDFLLYEMKKDKPAKKPICPRWLPCTDIFRTILYLI
jgi:mannan endo-1,4-beta-mannosidase